MVADSPSSLGQFALPSWAGTAIGAALGAALTWANGPSAGAILIAAILGLLYSVCQHRTTVLGYLFVGLSYGITLWIVTHILQSLHLVAHWPLAKSGQSNILLCIGFAQALAITALVASLFAGNQQQTLPKD